MTETLAKAILDGARYAGTEPEVRGNKPLPLVGYFAWMATEHPTEFATLLVEILGKELERGA